MIHQSENSILLECDCSCKSMFDFTLDRDKSCIYISGIEASFYSKQKNVFKKYVNFIKSIFGKEIFLMDVNIDINKNKDIVDLLYKLANEMTDLNKIQKNESFFKFQKQENFLGIILTLKQNPLNILLNKEYKGYELVLNKSEFLRLIKKIKIYMK